MFTTSCGNVRCTIARATEVESVDGRSLQSLTGIG